LSKAVQFEQQISLAGWSISYGSERDQFFFVSIYYGQLQLLCHNLLYLFGANYNN